MRVLWLGHNLAYPPKTGPLQRNYNLLRNLANTCEVHLLAFDQPATRTTDIAPEECIEALLKFCSSAEWVSLPKASRNRVASKSLISGQPYEFHWLRSPVMETKLRSRLEKVSFDVVHFDTLGLGQYLPLITKSRTILNHHDVQSSLIARRATIESNLILKQYWKLEARNLRNAEQRFCPQFDVNIAVSDQEGALLHAIAPQANVRVVPNGVDTSYFAPRPDPGGATLLFCGSLNMYPNADAMRYFFDDIWERLRDRLNNVEIYVVGRNPPSWLRQLGRRDPRIRVTDFVDDVRPYFEKATVFVCPVRDGGGTRLKILDSLAMGVPVVGTSFACSGLGLQHEKNVLFAETPDDFVTAVVRLLSDETLRNCLARSGSEVVQRSYSWEVIGTSLLSAYETAIRTT
jgi:glycosyltransferase involved in cell wall biosynthesis